MVLDRANKIAYACISPRTDAEVLKQWCDMMGYQPFTFHATYHGQEIYHTNVMMAIGDGAAVICLEVIEPGLRQKTREHLMSFGREVVELRLDQIDAFAGNMLAVRSKTVSNSWSCPEQPMKAWIKIKKQVSNGMPASYPVMYTRLKLSAEVA